MYDFLYTSWTKIVHIWTWLALGNKPYENERSVILGHLSDEAFYFTIKRRKPNREQTTMKEEKNGLYDIA
jgi:hypothetical protein